jgi:phosphoribosylcarboxyaminoimidazole (NCAIR) mutase
MVASLTSLPVIGVPIKTQSLLGLDSLLSIVQVSVLTVLSFKIQIEVNAIEF